MTVGAVTGLAALLAVVSGETRALPDYADWLEAVPQELPVRAQWVLGDITEPQFYKSWIASLGLLLGASLAWWAQRRTSRLTGEPIAYGSGLWPWMLVAAGLSLVLSNTTFGPDSGNGSPPTFVPFVSVAAAVVLIFGAGWPTALTGAVLGALTTPLATVLIDEVSQPAGLPPVVGCTVAMSIGATLTFVLCRALPWMTQADPEPDVPPTIRGDHAATTLGADAVWAVRRIARDFTEAQFYANEWATLGMLAGLILTAVLNPEFAAYGSGLLPRIIVAQALTSAIGVVVWRRRYRAGGWAATYVSVVSVAPATVLAYSDSNLALILGAAAGAVLGPAIARPVSAALPADVHPFIGNTVAMAIATTLVVPAIGVVA